MNNVCSSEASGVTRSLPWLMAMSAWLSMNPYILWGKFFLGKPTSLILVLTLSTIALLLAVKMGAKLPRGIEKAGVVLLALFAVYITLQPQLAGGHTIWLVVLPTLFCLTLVPSEVRINAFRLFSVIFACSLLPGVLVSLWMILDLPVTFTTIPAANLEMALSGTRLLHLPGMLFTETNSIILPYGGTLFRLNGVYDEPGMVGTIAALVLAGHSYRLRSWHSITIYAAGLLSFSLAFAILSILGFAGRALIIRKISPLAGLLPLAILAFLILSPAKLTAQWGTSSSVNIAAPTIPAPAVAPTSPNFELQSTPEMHIENIKSYNQKLRATDHINNRTLPDMQRLLDNYWASDVTTILFGIASDASVVRAPTSQVWKRILTNHGLLGFTLLTLGSLAIAWSLWLKAKRSAFTALFFLLFALSFYQRPVIWMPYTLLLLMCVPVYCASEERTFPAKRNLNTAM